jgi:hypothetical protein
MYFEMFWLFFILITYSRGNHVYFQGIELLSDANYSQGFSVIPACSTDCSKAPRLRLYNPFSIAPNSSASWEMTQWASHSNITTNGTFIDDGKSKGIQWSTNDKSFTLFQDGRLQTSVNGYHEYEGKYKAPDVPGVAFLIQQTIGISAGALPLDQVTELRWNLDSQLIHMDQHIQSGYDSNIHAVIFPLYMTIQNLVQGDPEYGKYFWLGIGTYDDRVLMSPQYVNGDKGTGALIYSPAFLNFANISLHSGNVVHITGNMMPFVKLGLQAAFERQFLNSTDLKKYYVGGMNIGWEVTGLNNGTIQIQNLSLKQYTAQNPYSYEFNYDKNMEGWKIIFHLEKQSYDNPLNGQLILIAKDNDLQLLSPILMIDTSVVKKIIINTAIDHFSNNHLQLFWSTDEEELFHENESISIKMDSHRECKEYVIDLSSNVKWNGIVRRLRINLLQHGNGTSFRIDYVRFAG